MRPHVLVVIACACVAVAADDCGPYPLAAGDTTLVRLGDDDGRDASLRIAAHLREGEDELVAHGLSMSVDACAQTRADVARAGVTTTIVIEVPGGDVRAALAFDGSEELVDGGAPKRCAHLELPVLDACTSGVCDDDRALHFRRSPRGLTDAPIEWTVDAHTTVLPDADDAQETGTLTIAFAGGDPACGDGDALVDAGCP